MLSRLYTAGLLALYQLSLFLALTLLPVALLAEQVGVTLPMHRVLDPLTHALEQPDRH
jgi:hypothetical protein